MRIRKSDKNILFNCAKGSWQRYIVNNLIENKIINDPIDEIHGSAKNYINRYRESFDSLVERINKCGYKLNIKGNGYKLARNK